MNYSAFCFKSLNVNTEAGKQEKDGGKAGKKNNWGKTT